ncbi:hypothetical protein HYX58_04110 [Candidatus Dependentiae bacterium]|nr:hypothetical protein [Candidatus Dependentiae bacterium]
MAHLQSPHHRLSEVLTLHPAHLVVGNEYDAKEAAMHALKNYWCTKKGCGSCIACIQLKENQHHGVYWAFPDPNYTLAQIDELLEKTLLSLQENEHFFLILKKTDFLSAACANRMLKILEEPPRGYHFILLAERTDGLLVTIRSRCLVTDLKSIAATAVTHPIASLFVSLNFKHPDVLLKLLDEHDLHDRQTLELTDQLLAYWLQKKSAAYKESEKNQTTACIMVDLLKEALLHPPMPGSSKLFWKNMYLKAKKLSGRIS